ncbi:hypothetical protein D3C84_591070 [compost metagenome]
MARVQLAEAAEVTAQQLQVGGAVQLMGEQVEVQALEPQPGFAGEQRQRLVEGLLVETEGRRLAAHHQATVRRLGEPEVEPQQHRRPAAVGPGDDCQAAQLAEAFDVEGGNPTVHGGGQLAVQLAGAAEDQRLVRMALIQPAQFAAGGRLEAVDPGRQGAQDWRLGVGLGGVEQLAVGRQRFAQSTCVARQRRQVVEVGAQRLAALAAQLGDGVLDGGGQAHRQSPRAAVSGLGRAV